jgi:hypothetical protein
MPAMICVPAAGLLQNVVSVLSASVGSLDGVAPKHGRIMGLLAIARSEIERRAHPTYCLRPSSSLRTNSNPIHFARRLLKGISRPNSVTQPQNPIGKLRCRGCR